MVAKRRGALGLLAALLAAALAVSAAWAAAYDHIDSQDFLAGAPGNFQLVDIAWDGTYFRVLRDNGSVITYTSDGTYTSSENFTASGHPLTEQGITWDGTYFRVAFGNGARVWAYDSTGTRVSGQDFNLASGNGGPSGIAWDGTYFRVSDLSKVFTYTSDGTYSPGQDFNLDSANGASTGIDWDGTYYRVVDLIDDKVYAYSSTGTYTPAQDFDLASGNTDPRGITWDGGYLRVPETDSAAISRNVFTYEGLPSASLTNYGLADDVEYAVAFSTTTVAFVNWKCIQSQTGEALRINNVAVTLHGFCAKNKDDNAMEVEIHLSSTAEYANLQRFADVTGPWWFVEVGATALWKQNIYDDAPVIAFRAERGGLDDSDRLGFDTRAKLIEDADCTEDSNGTGFTCSRVNFGLLDTGDNAVLLIALTDDNALSSADTPQTPSSLGISRNAGYTEATLGWQLYDAVTQYEVERLTAVQVSVGGTARIEYGDTVTYTVAGTQAGVDEYLDNTVESNRTYQYRVRARGADGDSWSAWSDYAYTGAKPGVLIEPPGNLQLDRDAESVMATWSAPVGEFDNYTLQRQEMVVVEGSTFFANVITLGGATWLPGASTTYTDTHIIPTQIYEYRIAAVKDDQVGTYSDWFRVGPPNTSLGESPANFKFLSSRILDDRREFWVAWDDVPGTDDYEVQLLVYDVATGAQSMEEHLVTDATYFHTSYGRVGLRVRGRKLDTDLCDSSPDDRCLTEWTGWYEIRFTPTVTIAASEVVNDTADASIVALRTDTEELLEAMMSPAGATVDGARVIQFLVVVSSVLVAGLCVAISWRRGMAPLGVGMGAAIMILILFTGYRLFGTPLAWPVAAQSLVAVAGIFALVRQTGVFR